VTSWYMRRYGLAVQGTNIRRLADHITMLVMVVAAVLAIIGCSGDTEWRYIPNDGDSARWWISPDGRRSLIVDRTSNDAYYFDNTPGHLCFMYSVSGIQGEWLPARQDGLFSVGSNVLVGVGVYHCDELPGSRDEPILDRAVALLERDYQELFGSVTVTVTPFQPDKLHAITWDAIWEMTVEGERAHVRATKILIDYRSEWVVQISVGGTDDDSVIVDQIVNSFRTTDASERFWPEIDRVLTDIGGFSDARARERRR
jgi:hypothetical protein